MNKFDLKAALIIGAIFPFIVLIIGIAIDIAPKNIIALMTYSYMLGIIVGPNILYAFANPRLKIYLVAGPVGMAFIKLSIKLFASDSKVNNIEIEKLKKYMTKEFGEEIGIAAKEYADQNFQISESTYDICRPLVEMSYANRIGIISQLFAMALSDNELCNEEEMVMQKISRYLHIGKKRYNIIKSNNLGKNSTKNAYYYNQDTKNQQNNQGKGYQFLNQFFMPTYNPYLILGLENSVSNEELKKAYRDLAKKYHPDVLMNKSEQIRKQAKDKFLEINGAYESIKKVRGIK